MKPIFRSVTAFQRILAFAWSGVFTVLITARLQAQLPGQAPEPIPLPHPDLAPPEVPPAPVAWWLIALGIVAVLILLGVVIALLFRLRKEVPRETVSPLKVALDRLEGMQWELSRLPPSEAAHRVSVILRDYLQARYSVPAPYRTSEELYSTQAIQAREGIRERFGPVAEFHDRMEFAPQPATLADCTKLMEEALQVLRDEKRYSPSTTPPPIPKNPPSLPFVPTKM